MQVRIFKYKTDPHDKIFLKNKSSLQLFRDSFSNGKIETIMSFKLQR